MQPDKKQFLVVLEGGDYASARPLFASSDQLVVQRALDAALQPLVTQARVKAKSGTPTEVRTLEEELTPPQRKHAEPNRFAAEQLELLKRGSK